MPTHPLIELTAADVSLLREERDASAHMHVGGVSLFDGPAPSITDLRTHVLERLERVPRYRTTVVPPPLGIGRPHWAVDPNFTIEFHVRHAALPCPGDERELRTAAARLFSQRLDRRRPLWELWMIEGLEDGRFAIVTKSHQALVDGIGAVDLMTALLDAGSEPEPVAPSRRAGIWLAPPLPTSAQLVASAARDAARVAIVRPLRLAALAARPAEALAGAAAGAAGLGDRVSRRLKPAPPSPLNVPIGPHRRLARTAMPVADLKRVKDTFGGTVNDVVLAVVAGAVRAWMTDRGLQTDGVELRVAVPVAVEARRREARPIALLHAPLPIGEPDPLVRFERIRRAMSEATAGHDVVAAERLTSSERFAPPTVLAQVARLRFDERRFNLLVANVPGPTEDMFLLGRRLETVVPVPFLSGERSLAIAVTSYAGTAEFGLLGDLDKLADIDVLAEGLDTSIAELLTLARRGRRSRRVRRSAPTAD
ncbi:wax ester/triacylglycerol synthase family O-acyltransferase [Patulibacter sp.]|uniref:wax ester/triacylglycerol synthase family O-acyltransferase n=1 Tax=Patulibacter sp. TaxID=1912859 RepID=UPI0027265174|nr:wax ester/triacylglycerol synthase family O-acyltransferase [Patulibacter sp.]MDO9409150.1 wax ester/triacylglycerol synthase family O-acyltransferase [Patulibacter sp.]